MLILSRKIGESIVIDDKITIEILGIKGNQIRLGAIAPKEIPIHRKEIHERIKQEREIKNAND